MRNELRFKPLKLPTLNEMLGVEDNIMFKFVFVETKQIVTFEGEIINDIDYFYVTDGVFIINKNKLFRYYKVQDKVELSNYQINDLLGNKNFIGIQLV